MFLEENNYVLVGALENKGLVIEEKFYDVQPYFFCLCPTFEEWDLMIMGLHWGDGVSLLGDELPPQMTNWFLRGNHERFDPLRSIIFELQCQE